MPISKITRVKCTGGVAQVTECLLCKYKALRSNPSPTKKNLFSFLLVYISCKKGPYCDICIHVCNIPWLNLPLFFCFVLFLVPKIGNRTLYFLSSVLPLEPPFPSVFNCTKWFHWDISTHAYMYLDQIHPIYYLLRLAPPLLRVNLNVTMSFG
jgi:hypothetical protein